MKTLLTLLSAGLFTVQTQSQPVLTAATNSPVIGTSNTISFGPYMEPGNAGADQIWDLSSLSTDSISMIQTVPPGSTPNGAQIPMSTAAEMNDAFTLYYNVDATGVRYAGSDDGVSLIVFSTMSTYLPFPCTFGTSWNSPQNGTYTYEGTQVVRTGTYTGNADGYGTLVTPTGTINNVLRVHATHSVQDVMGPMTINFLDDSYFYYAPGQFHPIAEVKISTIDMGFGPITKQFTRWMSDISTAVDAQSAKTFSVYPNPASDDVNISLTPGFGTPSSLTVIDMAGRTVLYELLHGTRANSLRINVSSLFSGMYHLTITTTDGSRITVPLIVE